jgi:predicted AAA+ superfamily ATPase
MSEQPRGIIMCINDAAKLPRTAMEIDVPKNTEMSEEEALGKLVGEILSAGKTLSRKTLCYEVLKKLDEVEESPVKKHYSNIFKKLLSG